MSQSTVNISNVNILSFIWTYHVPCIAVVHHKDLKIARVIATIKGLTSKHKNRLHWHQDIQMLNLSAKLNRLKPFDLFKWTCNSTSRIGNNVYCLFWSASLDSHPTHWLVSIRVRCSLILTTKETLTIVSFSCAVHSNFIHF